MNPYVDAGTPTSDQLLGFARYLREMKPRMVRDRWAGSGYRLTGDRFAPVGLIEAVVFVWQGPALHDDMNVGTRGRRACDIAAAVCESLAYDNTDGPA